MKKLAVLGDIHGNYEALKAVLEDSHNRHVDNYVVLGDIANRGPEPLECFKALKNIHPLAWVLGNHEAVYSSLIHHNFKNFVDNSKAVMAVITSSYDRDHLGKSFFRWLSERPLKSEIKIENIKIIVFHSTPDNCRGNFSSPLMGQSNFDELMAHTDAEIGIYGHTHKFILRMTTDGRYIFNPGSVGMPVSRSLSLSGKASYGILTIHDKSVLKWEQLNVSYDINKELLIAQKRRLPYLDLYSKLLQTSKFTFDSYDIAKENSFKNYVYKAQKIVNGKDW